jgi:hypothetical protein
MFPPILSRERCEFHGCSTDELQRRRNTLDLWRGIVRIPPFTASDLVFRGWASIYVGALASC